MPIAAVTQFPSSFVAGDTVRITLSDPDHPSTAWSLQVQLQGANSKATFNAAASGAGTFSLVLNSADTAKLAAGEYSVFYLYTETSSGERVTDDETRLLAVLPDPAAKVTSSTAQQILDALEATLKVVAQDPDTSVNFNGQSYTSKNLKDLQDAIVRQKQIVNFENNQRRIKLGQPSNRFSKLRFG
jgi:hypothetical protein